MGEENNIFGECKFGFMSESRFCELGVIVKDSVKFEVDDTEEIDKIRVSDKIEASFSVDLADPDLPKFIGADYSNGESYCSVLVTGEHIVNRPKRLKYPHRKRARRIWKKWKRRFGCRPTSSMLFPKARVDVDWGSIRISGVADE